MVVTRKACDAGAPNRVTLRGRAVRNLPFVRDDPASIRKNGFRSSPVRFFICMMRYANPGT